MTVLVIVESPGKVDKIKSYLGDNYRVVASYGHIRDLPPSDLGINPDTLMPSYVLTKSGGSVISRIKGYVSSSSQVLLATDPDREGEAIAWHLSKSLGLKNAQRVTFKAITKDKVLEAVGSPRPINIKWVQAQEARRVLDRIVGWRVSPALGNRLSAGRVQSPALRLVVDRERERTTFQAVKHFGVTLVFINQDGREWTAKYDASLPSGEKRLCVDADEANRVAAISSLVVHECENSFKKRVPDSPFITSTLQQAASKNLKMRPKATMDVAQKLFDKGLITYHRTDACNFDPAGVEDIKSWARKAGLPVCSENRVWKTKPSAQEGHEAIRPIHVENIEAGDTPEEKALYRLIWLRAVASQLEDAIYAVRNVILRGDNGDGESYFVAKGATLTSPGWLSLRGSSEDADSNCVPDMPVESSIDVHKSKISDLITKPPSRYTEADLIKKLESLGIGRPSTYASIMENISGRSYIAEDESRGIYPTSIGEAITDALVSCFSFVNYDYTKNLEEMLDLIYSGETSYSKVVGDAWRVLESELTSLKPAAVPIENPCPICGKQLVRIKGEHGFFWGCTGYPECKNIMADLKGVPVSRESLIVKSDEPCSSCGKTMVRKKGASGHFWGCEGYPSCKNTLPDVKGKPGPPIKKQPLSDIACPSCGKPLVRRSGVTKPVKKGAKGQPYDFYGCSGYPECKSVFKSGADGAPIIP